NDKVEMEAHFEKSHIRSGDLGFFAEYLRKLNETWEITGDFKGTVIDFKLSRAQLHFGTKSQLNGEFTFKGLPDIRKTGMFFKLEKSILSGADVVQYYPQGNFLPVLQKFGTIRANVLYAGSIADFTVKGQINTDIGAMDTDIVFQARESHNTAYKGILKPNDLNLGILLD